MRKLSKNFIGTLFNIRDDNFYEIISAPLKVGLQFIIERNFQSEERFTARRARPELRIKIWEDFAVSFKWKKFFNKLNFKVCELPEAYGMRRRFDNIKVGVTNFGFELGKGNNATLKNLCGKFDNSRARPSALSANQVAASHSAQSNYENQRLWRNDSNQSHWLQIAV